MNTLYTISQSLEYFYDLYSPVIYGVALQISSDEKEAEKILIASFKKINKLELFQPGSPNLSIKLIKLTIEVACELFPKYTRGNLELKQFRKLPVLHRLICENLSIGSLCTQFNLTTQQLMKRLRAELSLLSNVKKMYLVRAITISA
jgi:hypothetical protein